MDDAGVYSLGIEVNDSIVQELPIVQTSKVVLCHLHHIKLPVRRIDAPHVLHQTATPASTPHTVAHCNKETPLLLPQGSVLCSAGLSVPVTEKKKKRLRLSALINDRPSIIQGCPTTRTSDK